MSCCSMKIVRCHALFLALSIATRAISAEVEGCTLEPVEEEQGIKVFYTTSTLLSGCVSHGAAKADLEIHVLRLKYSDPSQLPDEESCGTQRMAQFSGSHLYTTLGRGDGDACPEKGHGRVVLSVHTTQAFTKLNVSVAKGAVGCNRKAVFVLNSNSSFTLVVQMDDCPVSFVSNKPSSIYTSKNVNLTDLPASSEELLKWARRTYGGVSSFAILENPRHIHFQIGRGPSTPEDCVPESNFDARDYLEVEVASSEIKSCLTPGGPLKETAHVLWLEQDPHDSSTQEVDVSMKTACNGGEQKHSELLVLRGRPGILWTINQMLGYLKFWASGDHYFNKMFSVNLPGTPLPDNIEGLIQMIISVNRSIASFTVIPSAKSITLELLKCETQMAVAVGAATSPPALVTQPTDMAATLVNMLKPWRCTDHGLEIALLKDGLMILPTITEITLDDPGCKARDNTTHYVLSTTFDNCKTHLEGGIRAKNQLILTQASIPDKIAVPFQCDLPEKLRLQLYRSPDFSPSSSTSSVEVDKVTYVQVSLRTAEKAPLMPYDCLLQPTGTAPTQQLIRDSLPLTHVEIFPVSSPKTSHFSFTYNGKGDVSSATLFCKMFLASEKEIRYFNGSLEVKIEDPSSPAHNQGLGIGAVLGITFGAFLIGVLLTAALWYIYSHTRPTAKMQPPAANLPASESSSTNHSIGSTQSTPCSTSSMA